MLLGDADDVISYLQCELVSEASAPASKPPSPPREPAYKRVGDSHVSLFNGAEGGRWLDEFQRDLEATAAAADMVAVKLPGAIEGERGSNGKGRAVENGEGEDRGEREKKRQRV